MTNVKLPIVASFRSAHGDNYLFTKALDQRPQNPHLSITRQHDAVVCGLCNFHGLPAWRNTTGRARFLINEKDEALVLQLSFGEEDYPLAIVRGNINRLMLDVWIKDVNKLMASGVSITAL